MNEFELPDDIKVIEKLYESPEDEIKRLQEIIIQKDNVIKNLQAQLYPFLTSKY